jgi:hypothetical protein
LVLGGEGRDMIKIRTRHDVDFVLVTPASVIIGAEPE